MVAGGDQAHSSLEVVPQSTLEVVPQSTLEAVRQQSRYPEAKQWKPLPSAPGNQVTLDGGTQRIGDDGDLEVAPKKDVDRHLIRVPHVLAQRLSARRLIILCGMIGLILVIGAVLGGVLGSRHKSSVTASATSFSNSSATSPSVTPTPRNIAAVSFASNSINMTRVYFQDDVGQIMEASNSESNTTWSINKTGIRGKNGSVIAAAVSRPSLPLVSPVFYCQSSLADIN